MVLWSADITTRHRSCACEAPTATPARARRTAGGKFHDRPGKLARCVPPNQDRSPEIGTCVSGMPIAVRLEMTAPATDLMRARGNSPTARRQAMLIRSVQLLGADRVRRRPRHPLPPSLFERRRTGRRARGGGNDSCFLSIQGRNSRQRQRHRRSVGTAAGGGVATGAWRVRSRDAVARCHTPLINVFAEALLRGDYQFPDLGQ